MRFRMAQWLRSWADLLDRDSATFVTDFSFTFETGEGIRLRDDGRGCPIAYIGTDYERAHAESDTHPFGIDFAATEAFAVRHASQWFICHQVGPSERYPETTYTVAETHNDWHQGETWLAESCEAVIPLNYEPKEARR